MWVIFLLAALSTAIATLLIIFITHKVIMKIENDRKFRKRKRNKK